MCAPHASSTISGTPWLWATSASARHVGDGAEVGRARRSRQRRRPASRASAPSRRLGDDAVGDPELVVDLGSDERRAQPGQDEGVDRARMAVALEHDLVAVVGEREAGCEVALRGAVDEEPGPRRAPGAGGEPLRLLERRRRSGRCRCPRSAPGCRGASAAAPITSTQRAGRRPGRPCAPGCAGAPARAPRSRGSRPGRARRRWPAARALRAIRQSYHGDGAGAIRSSPMAEREPRARRSCHAVPGTSERFLAKAPTLGADEVFLDLEDARRRDKELRRARRRSRRCGRSTSRATTVAVRVNATDTPHYYRDLIDVVEQAGARLDAVILPKVRTPGDVEMTAKLLTQIELARGLELGRDRHRGADRGRRRPDRRRGDRHRLAAHGGADLRPRRLQRRGRHPGHDDRRRPRRLSRATTSTTSTRGSSSPRAPPASRRSTGPTRGSTTPTAWSRARGSCARSATTASGRSTPTRSPPSTRSSRPSRERVRARRARCSTRSSGRRRRGAFEGEMIDEANRKMAERIVRAGRGRPGCATA